MEPESKTRISMLRAINARYGGDGTGMVSRLSDRMFMFENVVFVTSDANRGTLRVTVADLADFPSLFSEVS